MYFFLLCIFSLRNVKGAEAETNFKALAKRIKSERSGFFYLVIDEGNYKYGDLKRLNSSTLAHYAANRGNLIDKFLKEIANYSNKVILNVTATGYSLLTQDSR